MIHPRYVRAFTLIELLVVVAILGILAALLFPTIGGMMRSSQVAKSSSNLRQIATGFQMYAGDNDGVIPAVASKENKTSPEIGPAGDKDVWWIECLAGYLGSKGSNREAGDLSPLYIEPCYRALVGKNNAPTWRGGYAMNTRVNLVRGEPYHQYDTRSSRYVRYKLASIRGDSVLVTMGAYEGFMPEVDGTVANERFSPSLTTPVPHNKRIGADKKGLGGKSALYLFADGSVKNLTPEDAKEFLKLR